MTDVKNSLLPVTVRKAVSTDVIRIYRLVRKWAEKRSTPFLGQLNELNSVAWILAKITGVGFTVVAEHQGRMVGCLCLSGYVPPPCEKSEFVLDGEFFAVLPGLEHRGVGAALLRALRVQTLKAPVRVRLNACDADLGEVGDQLLTKIGFKEVGRVFVLPLPPLEPEPPQELVDDNEQEPDTGHVTDNAEQPDTITGHGSIDDPTELAN
jgi:N-acetylglutamate synthase-like GNAT family acetyltransferase